MKTYVFKYGRKTKRVIAEDILKAQSLMKKISDCDYKFVTIEDKTIIYDLDLENGKVKRKKLLIP